LGDSVAKVDVDVVGNGIVGRAAAAATAGRIRVLFSAAQTTTDCFPPTAIYNAVDGKCKRVHPLGILLLVRVLV
jgi:hypothetical protein